MLKQSLMLRACLVLMMMSGPALAASQFSAKLVDWKSRSVVDNKTWTGLYDFRALELDIDDPMPVDPLGRGEADLFAAHCIQRFEEISGNGVYEFSVVSLDEAPDDPADRPTGLFSNLEVDKLRGLWAIEFSTDETTGDYLFQSGWSDKRRFSAAQKAIWTITDGITLGSNTIDDDARAYLSELDKFLDDEADQPYLDPVGLQAFVHPTTQDFMGMFDLGLTTTSVVPVPGAAWGGLALLGGIGGAGMLRRRRARP